MHSEGIALWLLVAVEGGAIIHITQFVVIEAIRAVKAIREEWNRK